MTATNKGYDFGKPGFERSPVTLQDLELIKRTVLWSDEDNRSQAMPGAVHKTQIADVLDVWYGYVGNNSHLIQFFQRMKNQIWNISRPCG